MTEDRIRSKLYVVVEAGPAAADRLSAALAANDVASVLIRPAPGAALDASSAQPLVKIAQGAGAAALLADNAELVRVVKADGVHLSPSGDPAGDYEEAREILGNRYIVGADTGGSRDDAMTLAEIGADYVAFSAADEGGAEWRDELAGWWAEIFEVPCVALDVTTADEAIRLQSANADFIGITLPGSQPPAAAAELVKAVHAALATAYAEAQA